MAMSTQDEELLLRPQAYGTTEAAVPLERSSSSKGWRGRLVAREIAIVALGLILMGAAVFSKVPTNAASATETNLLTTLESCNDGAWMDDIYQPEACGTFDVSVFRILTTAPRFSNEHLRKEATLIL